MSLLANWFPASFEAWLREDVWELFLNGFAVNLVLPLVLGLLIWVLVFRGLRNFGAPDLFRRPGRPVPQFMIGIGVATLVWQVFLAGYLFEEFATNYTVDRPPFCEHRDPADGLEAFRQDQVRGPYDTVRFRYQPTELTSFVLYAWHVILGAAGVAGAVALVWLARSALARVCFARPLPLPLTAAHARRADESPAPAVAAGHAQFAMSEEARALQPLQPRRLLGMTVALLGALVGIGVLVMLTMWAGAHYEQRAPHVASAEPFPLSVGAFLLDSAGWGDASERIAKTKHYQMHARLGAISDIPPPSATVGAARAETRWIKRPYFAAYAQFAIVFVLVLIFSIALYVIPVIRFVTLVPAVGIVLVLHGIVFAAVVFAYFVGHPHLMLPGLLLLLVVMSRTYKRSFPNLPDEPVSLQKFAESLEAGGPPRGAKALLSTDAIASLGKRPMVFLCVSGGGSRSAAWTMKMLTKVEATFQQLGIAFPYHVRLVSGASGGMIGAAYYVASLEAPDGTARDAVRRSINPETEKPITREELNATVRVDFLTPVVNAFVYRDLPSLVVPLRTPFDRGRAIEDAWRDTLYGQLDKTFDALLPGEREGWRPSLLFSPFLVEDGRQLLISNLDLRDVCVNRANILGEKDGGDRMLSREGIELFKLFPDAVDFRVATAVRMSASFPYVMPAVSLPTDPPRRVVDASYYDTYGVGVAASYLFTNLERILQQASGVVVVQIRDGVSEADRKLSRVVDDARGGLASALEFATSPAEALLAVRRGTQIFRNDNLLHLLDLFFRQRLAGDADPKLREQANSYFATVAFECPKGDDIAMSFTLTKEEQNHLDAAAEAPEIDRRLAALTAWWKARS